MPRLKMGHQEAKVVLCRTTDGEQGIAQGTVQPTEVNTVIGLQVTNVRFDCDSPLGPTFLLLAKTLELDPFNYLHVKVFIAHPAKAKFDHWHSPNSVDKYYCQNLNGRNANAKSQIYS